MSKQAKIQGARDIVAPMLEEGEEIELVTNAMIGRFSTMKSMRFGFLVAILTLGLFYGLRAPKKFWLVATNRRLVFLEMADTSGKPLPKVAAILDRSSLRTTGTRSRRVVFLTPVLEVDFAGADPAKPVQLTFPTPCRKDGQQLADAQTQASRTS